MQASKAFARKAHNIHIRVIRNECTITAVQAFARN